MASSSHPLFALLGPLRYACARDFLNLSSIKELRPALAGAISRSGTGVKASTTAVLTAQLVRIDDRDLEVRKSALVHVLLAMRDEGLPIDFLPGAPPQPSAPREVLVLSASEPAQPTAPPPAVMPAAKPVKAPKAKPAGPSAPRKKKVRAEPGCLPLWARGRWRRR
jgi:ATP-dependent DNA helicase RecG